MRREKTKLYEDRVNRFLNRLQGGLVFDDRRPMTATFAHSADPVAFERRLEGSYLPIGVGTRWGDAWDSAWFHIQGRVPESWKGRQVVAHLGFGGEACVFGDDGCPLYGLTNGSVFSVHFGKDVYPLLESASGGEDIEIWVEAAANNLFGIRRENDPSRSMPERHGTYDPRLTDLELCVFDDEMWGLMHDVRVLDDLMRALPEDTPRRARILIGLNRAVDAFADDRANASAARQVLVPLLASPANASDLRVTAVGHAHIDTGWLWPVRESRRKCARTFSSQVALLERYPDYVFGASQAQLYAFVKQDYPALYEKIQAWVGKGRWEIQGGMWVEPDCNLVSGESMVRQFLHGKNYFKDEFGVDVRNLWLPDVFGYSASMPQILRKSGVDYFLTQKISWSQFNRFPHNTFLWEGIDGTEVLTHFPPEDTYNSELTPRGLVNAQTRFKENGTLDEYICLYGIGNGGGGPKEDHVERGLRMGDLEGSPKLSFGRADDFFERIDASRSELERWVGELYLELHRGTLTTQARTKLGNRRLEQRLRDVEFLCACLPLDRYPAGELDRIWKILLTNQFHDILPGSSIRKVYDVAEGEYADCLAACDGLIASAASDLLTPDAECLTLYNTLSVPYTRPVELPKEWAGSAIQNGDGEPVPSQSDGSGAAAIADIPPHGFVTLRKAGPATSAEPPDGLVLENDLVRYAFAEDGTLSAAFDKEAGREILDEGGRGNLLSLYVDRPNNWNAWDVDIFYEDELLETARSVRFESLGSGDVRQGIRFHLAIGASTISQDVHLSHSSKRLDFVTRVDWQEQHRMLRVSFATPILADRASFDIQYGYVKRPTHQNNSWDMAQFEVSAQRYADLSSGDYGVAVLNDCKYGHKVRGRVIDLNLLRSPNNPDPDADIGHHTFTYSLLPHSGDLIHSAVMAEAAMLNQRPVLLEGYRAGAATCPVKIDSEGVSLEVVKKAEKEDCLVVRLVETRGTMSPATLHVAGGGKLVGTNLIEWTDGEATDCGSPVALTLKPFELRTYKIRTP